MLLWGGGLILVVLFAWEAMSDELHIIEVRRNIPMSDQEPVYRDFYINGGPESGLKPNQIVTALRKVNVKDATGTHAFGEMSVPVGQLKIIFSQNHVAVAREYKMLSRVDLPMLEQTGVMIGDVIDLKGSFVDNRKSSAKTSSREEKAPSEQAKQEPSAEVPASPPSEPEDAEAKAPAPSESPEAAKDDLQKESVQSMADAMGKVANQTE